MSEPRTQQRGPITDFFGMWPLSEGNLALCVCVHGKQWPEGDAFEPEGRACRECCAKAWEESKSP